METQKYLVFQQVLKYFKPTKNHRVKTWKYLGLSNKNIKPLATTSNIVVQDWIILITLNFKQNLMQAV